MTKKVDSDWFRVETQAIWHLSSSHKFGTQLKSCPQIFTSLWCVAAFGEDVAPDFMGLSNDSVLIGPSFASAHCNWSKRLFSAWHTRTHFPSEAFPTSRSSRLCERARPKHLKLRNNKVSPESWVLSTHLEGSFHGRFRLGGWRTLRLIWFFNDNVHMGEDYLSPLRQWGARFQPARQQDAFELWEFVGFGSQHKRCKDRLSARDGENKCILHQDDTEAESEQMYHARICTHVICVWFRNAMYDKKIIMVLWLRCIEIEGACVLQSCDCRTLKKAFAGASMCRLRNSLNVFLNAWDQRRHIRTWRIWRSKVRYREVAFM